MTAKLRLGEFGRTFSTRMKARDIASTLRCGNGDAVIIDFAGVASISPSFADELLTQIGQRCAGTQYVNVPDYLAPMLQQIAERHRAFATA